MGGGGRRKASISAQRAVSENQARLRLSDASTGEKPQKPSLFCTSTRGNPQKSSLRERLQLC
jgi:hypothetical protein